MHQPLIGITVMPEYIQCEGVEAVLDRLQQAGANAVATSPYVMAEADEASGSREPPQDAGAGAVRLLDRPLWGRRSLWVRTAPSFEPQRELYRGLRYQPPPATELTWQQGPLVGQFLDAARRRGMRVLLQVQAAIPPGYRVQFGGPLEDDLPRLPDGSAPGRRVAQNGSLASPHIRQYQRALIHDLCRHYPQVDAIRFDWPEYPPYLIDSAFLDFSQHARRAAQRLGLDFDCMRRDGQRLYEWLHGALTQGDLQRWHDDPRQAAAELLQEYPGVALMLQLKEQLSEELLQWFRQSLDEGGGEHIELAPSSFPPPWSHVSGMSLRRAAACCGSVSVKLYGMHWAMMLNFYGQQLLSANPALPESPLVRALVRLLDIADDEGLAHLSDYQYPGPETPHPVGEGAQQRKIEAARRAAGSMPVHALAHGYGPADDFARRAETALRISPDGVWINRYAYLSDEKLSRLAALSK